MYIFLLSFKIENALYGILMVNNSILSISITDSGATQRQRYRTGDSFFHDKWTDTNPLQGSYFVYDKEEKRIQVSFRYS